MEKSWSYDTRLYFKDTIPYTLADLEELLLEPEESLETPKHK